MLETLIFAITLNLIMFVIAFRLKTDKLTDISYAATIAGIAVYDLSRNDVNSVKLLVFGLVLFWAARLGSYLMVRIHVMGRDKRFDNMRNNFWKFGRFWLLQGLTTWVVMLPASLFFNTTSKPNFNVLVIVGIIVTVCGLVIEAVADAQKFKFINNKNNRGKWIASGLWKYSRHPNYFGEILVWYGIYEICYSWLSTTNKLLALAGPLFIAVMLICVSGIPLLEKSADKKWGSDNQYRKYKRNTSVLIPFIRR